MASRIDVLPRRRLETAAHAGAAELGAAGGPAAWHGFDARPHLIEIGLCGSCRVLTAPRA
jgi:hypothetical protein